jgi:hypothetical protein
MLIRLTRFVTPAKAGTTRSRVGSGKAVGRSPLFGKEGLGEISSMVESATKSPSIPLSKGGDIGSMDLSFSLRSGFLICGTHYLYSLASARYAFSPLKVVGDSSRPGNDGEVQVVSYNLRMLDKING